MWSVHLIAGELENPFDCGANDLDLHALQDDLNEKLRAICRVESEDVPSLVVGPEVAASRLSTSKAETGYHEVVKTASSKVRFTHVAGVETQRIESPSRSKRPDSVQSNVPQRGRRARLITAASSIACSSFRTVDTDMWGSAADVEDDVVNGIVVDIDESDGSTRGSVSHDL